MMFTNLFIKGNIKSGEIIICGECRGFVSRNGKVKPDVPLLTKHSIKDDKSSIAGIPEFNEVSEWISYVQQCDFERKQYIQSTNPEALSSFHSFASSMASQRVEVIRDGIKYLVYSASRPPSRSQNPVQNHKLSGSVMSLTPSQPIPQRPGSQIPIFSKPDGPITNTPVTLKRSRLEYWGDDKGYICSAGAPVPSSSSKQQPSSTPSKKSSISSGSSETASNESNTKVPSVGTDYSSTGIPASSTLTEIPCTTKVGSSGTSGSSSGILSSVNRPSTPTITHRQPVSSSTASSSSSSGQSLLPSALVLSGLPIPSHSSHSILVIMRRISGEGSRVRLNSHTFHSLVEGAAGSLSLGVAGKKGKKDPSSPSSSSSSASTSSGRGSSHPKSSQISIVLPQSSVFKLLDIARSVLRCPRLVACRDEYGCIILDVRLVQQGNVLYFTTEEEESMLALMERERLAYSRNSDSSRDALVSSDRFLDDYDTFNIDSMYSPSSLLYNFTSMGILGVGAKMTDDGYMGKIGKRRVIEERIITAKPKEEEEVNT
ncbi:hypothetical protein ADUPG1_008009 [Aduncisulcus paluster]|uniref:Uncharacterized protein n=1 Tax=Aduncisulcus paluster TaxID=2918883 RepID=A0ABQ5KTG0_9EUKA|nr:hypothetical protein ADUPG1_008009 [Aduncisulcus paluster]